MKSQTFSELLLDKLLKFIQKTKEYFKYFIGKAS